jgi:hypothetical protein
MKPRLCWVTLSSLVQAEVLRGENDMDFSIVSSDPSLMYAASWAGQLHPPRPASQARPVSVYDAADSITVPPVSHFVREGSDFQQHESSFRFSIEAVVSQCALPRGSEQKRMCLGKP